MDEYFTSSDNAAIPAMIKVKMFDSTGNVKGTILPFIFTDKEKNKKMMDFLKNESIDNDVK